MQLRNIRAIPHPSGNRIDLTWENPKPKQYPRVHVVRREDTHPTALKDGVLVPHTLLFSLELGFQSELDSGTLSTELQQKFLDNGIPLSGTASLTIEVPGSRWLIVDGDKEYITTVNDSALNVFNEFLTSAVDQGLKGETVYYYTLFPYKDDPAKYYTDRHNRASAMATAPYNMAGQMYQLLPAIYHRYDTVLPKESHDVSEEDRKKGQLRRFLDLPGNQLDLLHSFARAMLELHNVSKVDGNLLPLLAQWISWSTNYTLEIDDQRNEIRNAPHLYKTTGIIPTVEATIKRIIDWESQTKEFVHNVLMTNRPERLNLWEFYRVIDGEWSKSAKPLSLDFAYEGRSTSIRDGNDGSIYLFYHTRGRSVPVRNGEDSFTSLSYHSKTNSYWDIWYKKLSVFSITAELLNDLDANTASIGLQQAFKEEGFSLSQNAVIEKDGLRWVITDSDNNEIYIVMESAGQLSVYSSSKPLTNRTGLDDRHPSAVVWGNSPWIFWDSYDVTNSVWHINYCYRSGSKWSSIYTFGDVETERKTPAVVVDRDDNLCLFWLERNGTSWQMKYKRFSIADGEPNPTNSIIMGNGTASGKESDLFALFDDARQNLFIFWAYKDPIGGTAQTRWQIAYQAKEGTDPGVLNWSGVQVLPKATSDYNDREPAAMINVDGNLELFWSSDQDGSWSIWRSVWNIGANNWEAAEQIIKTPYSQRDPLPILLDAGTWLVCHSNESVPYSSTVYGATKTLDARYAGCTTVDTHNATKLALREQYEDFQTYTYDTGQQGIPTDEDWYRRDTIGLYLDPDTDERELIVYNQHLIKGVLKEFLPIQVRPVFIIPLVSRELVYAYDFRETEQPRYIIEHFFDSITSIASEAYIGLGDNYRDTVPEWIWMRTWSETYTDHRTVDFTITPVDTRYRIWHIGLEAGG